MDAEKDRSQYKSYMSREHHLGQLKKQEAWEKQRWNDAINWEWIDYEHKYIWIALKKESRESPYEACSETLVGFVEFNDWSYGEILTDKPHYLSHLWTEHYGSSPEKKMFTGRLERTEYSILEDAQSPS